MQIGLTLFSFLIQCKARVHSSSRRSGITRGMIRIKESRQYTGIVGWEKFQVSMQ
jgi:hypothetical protein